MAPRSASKTAESSDKVGVICRALRRAIIEQALEPGAKLPEDSLGERFGVSRTIARHALGQLAAEGLVELRRNRIAVVATPSWQEARDAFDIRIELERLVVRQLAGKLTKSQIAELNAHVDAEDRARDGSDAVSIRLATEFHILLANMTNSPILVRYVSEVAYRCCLTLSLVQPPAFVGMRDQRASRDHRGTGQGRRSQGDGPDAQPSGFGRQSRAGRPRPAARPRFAGYSGALCRGRRRRPRGEDAEGGQGEVARRSTVIASEAKQCQLVAMATTERLDCFVALLLAMTEGCARIRRYASIPRCTRMRSALSFQTSIFTIWPPSPRSDRHSGCLRTACRRSIRRRACRCCRPRSRPRPGRRRSGPSSS